MPAIPPKTDISGIVHAAADLIDAAFKRGVKHGRYLEQQEQPKIVRCKNCVKRGTRNCRMFYEELCSYDEYDMDWIDHDMTVDDGFCHEGKRFDEMEG